ncbi:hypothetical protein [Denitratisoma oestradiolicum]|uniref:DUF1877 family protein n=1 Tax=Denitratisoma oestradiolicum TaxID=311182 RepID=A0A6S6XTB2_9PROT|nr:hypothetical protein [Denitratisoma oestradiolicum]TWO82291.1 hypothetical protein CBW56_02285 [Denitratisoma oestradiolicum]CAB1369245.1 conserved protein of unknown function [Denitratisoma oestradiolicum]
MGILVNIIAAEEDEVESIGESLQPVSEWSGIELRDLSIAKIATIHCLLTGDLFDDAAALYDPIYISAAEGALVLRLADEMLERLVELDEDGLEAVTAELTETEEFESAGWGDDAIADMLADLADLARLAEDQGQGLFVWMHPLRT